MLIVSFVLPRTPMSSSPHNPLRRICRQPIMLQHGSQPINMRVLDRCTLFKGRPSIHPLIRRVLPSRGDLAHPARSMLLTIPLCGVAGRLIVDLDDVLASADEALPFFVGQGAFYETMLLESRDPFDRTIGLGPSKVEVCGVEIVVVVKSM